MSDYPPMPEVLRGSPLIEAYCRKTAGSAALAARARGIIPSGITHDARYIEPHGIYVTRAQGSHKWDVDGNEYVDYPGGHGALLLGHNHPEVMAAVERQLPNGVHYGAGHELELQWGELVQKMVPCAQRVRFTNSGTEATLLAIRLGRAFTGKPKLLRFTGHFHGWHDHAAFGFNSHYDGTPTPGVLDEVAANVLLAPPNDIEATARLLDEYNDIAAAIIEPTGSTWGQVPIRRDFLAALRELTAARGVVLIFDEVISGFRCAPGGIQEAWGIVPEMACFGKIIGGGMGGAAVAGRADILDRIDFRRASAAGQEKVFHMGTYNAMPAVCAAGIATLEIVRTTDACQRAIAYGRGLQDALNQMFAHEGVPWISYGSFGGFHVYLNPRGLPLDRDSIEGGACDYATMRAPVKPAISLKLRAGMLLHGVDIQGWPGAPISAAHTDDDRDRTVDAFRQTIRLLRAEGDLD